MNVFSGASSVSKSRWPSVTERVGQTRDRLVAPPIGRGQPRNRNTGWSRQIRFDMICEAKNIEHRLTKPKHPWTNGQVERMNRTVKKATVKRFHYETHEQLRTHLAAFMAAYNFARRLKTRSGLTPREYIAKIWTSEPDRFIVNPIHQMPGLNTSSRTSLTTDEPLMLTDSLRGWGRFGHETVDRLSPGFVIRSGCICHRRCHTWFHHPPR